LFLFGGIIFAQTEQAVIKEKPHQQDLLNEVYASYGIGSLYYYINVNSNSDWSYTAIGSFIIGYTRSMNKVIGVGFQIGYTPLSAKYKINTSRTKNYNYVQALARIKFQYLNKPTFAMYSGIAIGVTMNYYSETGESDMSSPGTLSKQELLPAAQLTLLGFRVGRGGAFCGEFGIGTLSIINLGVSIKFGQ
ncbi:MAG: hypothetical protein NTW31_13925, partial [Bacteroidetes bacterium]|nr:hypothetical protein [Bacteroidota bacterium]